LTLKRIRHWTEGLQSKLLHCFFENIHIVWTSCFVIIINYVGYEATLWWLLADIFKETNYILDNVQHGWAQWEDTFKKYILACQQSKKEKIRWRAEKKLKLMAQQVENSKAKWNGDFYGTGLALHLQSLELMATAVNAVVATSIQGQRLIPTKCSFESVNWIQKILPSGLKRQKKQQRMKQKTNHPTNWIMLFFRRLTVTNTLQIFNV